MLLLVFPRHKYICFLNCAYLQINIINHHTRLWSFVSEGHLKIIHYFTLIVMELILPSMMYMGKEKFSRAYFLIWRFFKTILVEKPKENFYYIYEYLCHVILRKILQILKEVWLESFYKIFFNFFCHYYK
jgi:hypothetical protein